jgi:hypothetical protein
VSTNGLIFTGRRRRRHHSELFKAEAVGACQQEGVSIAAVALPGFSMLRQYLRSEEGAGRQLEHR